MPVILMSTSKGIRSIPFVPGDSLLEILRNNDVRISSGCGGVGRCGSCLVRIEKGELNLPSASEQQRLTREQTDRGFRLACQVRPFTDVRVTVNPVHDTTWRNLSESVNALPSSRTSPYSNRVSGGGKHLGVAVDLGTTHIRLSLWDLERRERLAGRYGMNAQHRFGSDVMTRLTAAATSSEHAGVIAWLARDSIGEALLDISIKDGFSLAVISRVVIVGNSAMLALLAEKNYELLLKPTYWTKEVDCLPVDTLFWKNAWGISPTAEVELAPPLAGFVGSDLLAGVLATGLTKLQRGELLIDFGTNSEIALWDGELLWVTSAAGGPAFEGCGISCGMPAEPGAIFRIDQCSTAPDLHCEVIGGGEALGICGSGLVDIIALLRRDGRLNSAGRFHRQIGDRGIGIIDGNDDLTLKRQDIDAFQRAKAAIGAGTRMLLEKAGMGSDDLRRIYVCGAFGRLLNLKNAQEIGLLPDIAVDRIKLLGDSALAGCEQLLFPVDSTDAMEELRRKSQLVNLAQMPEFEDEFVKNLYLRPLT